MNATNTVEIKIANPRSRLGLELLYTLSQSWHQKSISGVCASISARVLLLLRPFL
jgi:hypothetical protein